MKIEGRTIVVTGASRGIGESVARALARHGGRLALLARSPDVQLIAAEIVAGGGDARGYIADLGDLGAVDSAAQQISAAFGTPDIIINNAGAGRWFSVEETPAAEVAATMAAPYYAAFYVTRAFLPAMLERRSGCIVNVNSPVAWITWPGASAYAAARWAMRGFTAALRLELRGSGIQVLQVVPGKVNSTYFEHNPHSEERLPSITRLIRVLSPDEVAAALIRGIERDRREVITPALLRATLAMHALAPALVDWVMWRTGWRREAPP